MSQKRIFTDSEQEQIEFLYCKEHLSQKKIGEKLNSCQDLIGRYIKQKELKKEHPSLERQSFGNLTVIKDDKYSLEVLCDCKCGKRNLNIKRCLLLSNRIKSCGCLFKKGTDIIPLLREKYGGLTVVSEYSENKKHWCICNCDCGTKNVLVLSNNLARGLTKSCGCLKAEVGIQRRKDLSRKRFGQLIALSVNEEKTNNSSRTVYWDCICDCGNKTTVANSKLTSGYTQSCGCIKSMGEKEIIQILINNQIEFKNNATYQLRFPSGRLAIFDFVVSYQNQIYLIEFDGIQHFYKYNTKWDIDGKFEKRKKI